MHCFAKADNGARLLFYCCCDANFSASYSLTSASTGAHATGPAETQTQTQTEDNNAEHAAPAACCTCHAGMTGAPSPLTRLLALIPPPRSRSETRHLPKWPGQAGRASRRADAGLYGRPPQDAACMTYSNSCTIAKPTDVVRGVRTAAGCFVTPPSPPPL